MLDIKKGSVSIEIKGNIKTQNHAKQIMDHLNQNERRVHFKIIDSISITSKLILHLVNFQKEYENLKITIHDKTLFNLFKELNLVRLLNISFKR